jgi:hypothetical protein
MRCAETCVPEGPLREQSAERTSQSGWALRGSAAVHGLTAPAKVPPTWGEIERTGHSFPCDWPSWARTPALPTAQHTLVTVEITCTHMKALPPTSPACMHACKQNRRHKVTPKYGATHCTRRLITSGATAMPDMGLCASCQARTPSAPE